MILAVLQARVSSLRLPGKVLKEIMGKPMLILQIERIQRSRFIDHLVVATSTETSDDQLADLCDQNGLECYRGSLNDVLDRFYQAAKNHHCEQVVRLTGDCPLADPEVIDTVIDRHLTEKNDYTSNCLEPTFPDGLDVEVMRFDSLERAWREARLISEREHVTPYINKQPHLFKLGNVKHSSDLSGLRWTVDETDDFKLVKIIYENLYQPGRLFTTQDILDFLEREPQLLEANARFNRNEGYLKSLAKDGKEN